MIDRHAAEFRRSEHAHQTQLRHGRKRVFWKFCLAVPLRGARQEFALGEPASQIAKVLLLLAEHVWSLAGRSQASATTALPPGSSARLRKSRASIQDRL